MSVKTSADDDENSRGNRGKSVDIQCKHCKKSVVNYVKCSKCLGTFHPACLVQGANQKSAICKHVAESPNLTSNSLGEIAYLLKIIRELEEKCDVLKENNELWKARSVALENQLRELTEGEKSKNNCSYLLPPKQKSAVLTNVNVNHRSDFNYDDRADVPKFDTRVCSQSSTSRSVSQGRLEVESRSPAPENENLSERQSTNDGFVYPKRAEKNPQRQNHERNHENHLQKYAKRKPQRGSCESTETEFGAASMETNNKKIWVFLSKVKETVTEDIVQEYIAKKANTNKEDVSVKLCTPKLKKGSTLRFMIGVKPEFKEIVHSEEFWPKGICFAKFNFSRGRNFLDNRESSTRNPQ